MYNIFNKLTKNGEIDEKMQYVLIKMAGTSDVFQSYNEGTSIGFKKKISSFELNGYKVDDGYEFYVVDKKGNIKTDKFIKFDESLNVVDFNLYRYDYTISYDITILNVDTSMTEDELTDLFEEILESEINSIRKQDNRIIISISKVYNDEFEDLDSKYILPISAGLEGKIEDIKRYLVSNRYMQNINDFNGMKVEAEPPTVEQSAAHKMTLVNMAEEKDKIERYFTKLYKELKQEGHDSIILGTPKFNIGEYEVESTRITLNIKQNTSGEVTLKLNASVGHNDKHVAYISHDGKWIASLDNASYGYYLNGTGWKSSFSEAYLTLLTCLDFKLYWENAYHKENIEEATKQLIIHQVRQSISDYLNNLIK